MSSAGWIRWQSTYDQHPDVVAAGWEGAVVFERVCRLTKLHGDRDTLAAKFWRAAWISRITGVPEEVVETGMAAIVEAGLVVETDHGIEIPGWRRFQPDPNKADRQKRWREKTNETEVDGSRRLHALRDAGDDDGTGQDLTIQDNKTGRKRDKPRSSPTKTSSGDVDWKARKNAALAKIANRDQGLDYFARELVRIKCEENKSGTMADSRIVRDLLDPLVSKMETHPQIAAAAWVHGFEVAVRAGAPNPNYVFKAAQGYRPPERRLTETRYDRREESTVADPEIRGLLAKLTGGPDDDS